ncbi:DUF3023 domain-containing protein [Ehrlichia muris]|uniref:DUF3023 domain-containing protein n=1 Tax=Ehrlichia muris TaxID=35795 RepID=UPI0037C05AD9
MLGSRALEAERSYNIALCRKISSCNAGLEIGSVCVVGNTGPSGKMLLHIDEGRKNQDLTVSSTGNTLFLVKGKIPASALRYDPELRALAGRWNMGPFTRPVKFQAYFLVNQFNINKFMKEVHARLDGMRGPSRMQRIISRLAGMRCLFGMKRITCFNLSNYGDFIVSRIPGGPRDRLFNACDYLQNFSNLELEFSVSPKKSGGSSCCRSCVPKSKRVAGESFVPEVNEEYELECAMAYQEFLQKNKIARERKAREEKYRAMDKVMTELMHLSIEGIESDMGLSRGPRE